MKIQNILKKMLFPFKNVTLTVCNEQVSELNIINYIDIYSLNLNIKS